MSSDQHLAANQFDEDEFPITIGFQPVDEGESAVESVENECELEGENAELLETDEATQPQDALTGYELVADMMRRQDEVLEQLDDLNARIELAIEEISAARKSEIDALEAEQQLLNDDDQAMDQQKAA